MKKVITMLAILGFMSLVVGPVSADDMTDISRVIGSDSEAQGARYEAQAGAEKKETPPKDWSVFSVTIDMMIGGGFAGAINSIEIDSTGEIYRITAPTFHDKPVKKLEKRVDKKTIESLRAALKAANLWKIDPGAPQYSGKAWDIDVGGHKRRICFISVPPALSKAQALVDEMLR
jgi:hypothetical protein